MRLAFSAVKCTVPKWQRRERRERQEERIDERRNERREERGFMYVKPTFHHIVNRCLDKLEGGKVLQC